MAERADVIELNPGMRIILPPGSIEKVAQQLNDEHTGKKKKEKVLTGAAGDGEPATADGRKDASGQSKVIQTSLVKDRLEHLCDLHQKAEDSKEALSIAIKATAEASGLLASVVKRRVVASVKDQYADRKREYDQLALLFSDTPE